MGHVLIMREILKIKHSQGTQEMYSARVNLSEHRSTLFILTITRKCAQPESHVKLTDIFGQVSTILRRKPTRNLRENPGRPC